MFGPNPGNAYTLRIPLMTIVKPTIIKTMAADFTTCRIVYMFVSTALSQTFR